MIYGKEYTLNEHKIEPSEKTAPANTRNESFSSTHSLKIHHMDLKDMEIDFIGFNFSLVNAYRRIVLAEVATMAIEKVHMYKNTSVLQDEVLAHRIGLVPLNVPPHFFNFRTSENESFNEDTCVKYRLRVKCRGKADSRGPQTEEDRLDDVDCRTIDKLVTSKDLQWVPIGSQEALFANCPLDPLEEKNNLPESIKDINSDLVLAKLNPGQRLLLEAYAFKGIGSDHAKFQPGLCWYRMLPQVTLMRRVLGKEALLLQKCFSPGVVDVITNEQGEEEAVVNDARNDSCSRNVHNYDCLKDSVEVGRKSDHIIFHIESQSALKSYEILESAVDVMIEKCDTLLTQLCKVKEQ